MPCASCRAALPPDARFCPACGSPCATRPVTARPTGRKVVTLLFCDLVGSTALSGALDAETLRSVTLRWFDLMRQRIEEQGGTVEKFIGDAVMAVFGVPTVREDDARRAVAAALAMREALAAFNTWLEEAVGVTLEMRIGVNTGQAVTGSATLRQAMVSGEVVNIAARLEQNAGAGEILIGPDTLAAAGPGVRTTPIGPLLLKGKRDRVTAHRLLGLDEKDDPEALRRFDLAFVGRAYELTLLDEALARVGRTRRPGRLVIGGEPGQGKTRLVREWLQRAGGSPGGGPRNGVGRCHARGVQPSLGPLADAVTDLLNTGTPAEPTPELDLLRQGLLLNGTPNPSPADTCAALAKVLADLSRTRPVVLVLDDCHWAAQPLFDALDRLLRALADAAVLIVLLTRPPLFDARPELAQEAVPLGGLSDADARLLAAELTGRTTDGEPLAAQILARVGGNPLHLEQLLLAGQPVDADHVPLPLQALIGARIDALDPPEHRALGLASVLGGDFTADDMAALAGRPEETWTPSELRSTLHRLVRHRLVRPHGEAFRFAGGLIQEVVYASQSKQDRADRHERAARLDSVRDRGDAAVGAHLEQAHRYRVELGAQDPHTDRLRRRAADALAEAGRLALAHADPAWAADLLTRAASHYTPGEPGRIPTRRRLGQTLLDLGHGEEGRALLEEVLTETGASGGGAGVGAALGGGVVLEGVVGEAVEVTDRGSGAVETSALDSDAAAAVTRGVDAVAASARDADAAEVVACGVEAVEAPAHGSGALAVSARGSGAVEPTAHGAHAEKLPVHGAHAEKLPVHGAHAEKPTVHGAHAEKPTVHGAHAEKPTAHGAHAEKLPVHGAHAEKPTAHGARAEKPPAHSTAPTPDAVEAAHARLALASAGPVAGREGESPAEAAAAALPVFAAAGDELGQARACLRLAQAAQEHGRHRAAERLLDRALRHAVRADAEPERAAALGAVGVSLWRGPQPVEEAVARCRALLADQGPGRRAVRLTLNCPLAVVLALHDDRDGALACLAEAEHLAKGLGYAEADAFLPIFTATVADLAGRAEEALACLERAASAARDLGATALLRSALLDAARIRLDLGEVPAAEAALAELAGPARPRAESADLDGLRARIAAARGHDGTATRLAARASATAACTDSPIVQGLAALDLARTALALGRPADAAPAALRARRHFAAKGHLPAVRHAEAVAAGCHGVTAAGQEARR
ncbi:adenylate/guanylate cyclase domain-containing protein [Streptomyces sp. NPDC096205]|uniref:adenylate/guanylate cyclase domain-containing protein n=1 Tax=Streptomyces sp. NPDC096205 TaxID=3366081 RepID=UPI00380B36F2